MEVMKNRIKILLEVLYLVGIAVLEVLAYRFNGAFSVVAAWLWLCTSLRNLFGNPLCVLPYAVGGC